MATARRPEPQIWFRLQAAASFGMPAPMAACRAGPCPAAACSTWPRMTSSTSSGLTPARSSAARMATSPSFDAGRLDRPPRKDPTGVRAAETMTTSMDML